MAKTAILVEVIGGPKTVLEVELGQPAAKTAAQAAEAVGRSILDDDGKEKPWKIYAPNRAGGFAPLPPVGTLEAAQRAIKKKLEGGGDVGFAGPGEHQGESYAFRIRLFVPSAPPPIQEPKTPTVSDDEVIDLTNLEGEESLESVRRNPAAAAAATTGEVKKRKRKRAAGESGKAGTRKAAAGRKRSEQRTADGSGEKKRRRKRRKSVADVEAPTGTDELEDLSADTSSVADEAGAAMADAPSVADEAGSAMADAPSVADEAGSAMADAPSVADEAGSAMPDTPSVADEAGSAMPDAPSAADQPAPVMPDAPSVADQTAPVMPDAPSVADESAPTMPDPAAGSDLNLADEFANSLQDSSSTAPLSPAQAAGEIQEQTTSGKSQALGQGEDVPQSPSAEAEQSMGGESDPDTVATERAQHPDAEAESVGTTRRQKAPATDEAETKPAADVSEVEKPQAPSPQEELSQRVVSTSAPDIAAPQPGDVAVTRPFNPKLEESAPGPLEHATVGKRKRKKKAKSQSKSGLVAGLILSLAVVGGLGGWLILQMQDEQQISTDSSPQGTESGQTVARDASKPASVLSVPSYPGAPTAADDPVAQQLTLFTSLAAATPADLAKPEHLAKLSEIHNALLKACEAGRWDGCAAHSRISLIGYQGCQQVGCNSAPSHGNLSDSINSLKKALSLTSALSDAQLKKAAKNRLIYQGIRLAGSDWTALQDQLPSVAKLVQRLCTSQQFSTNEDCLKLPAANSPAASP